MGYKPGWIQNQDDGSCLKRFLRIIILYHKNKNNGLFFHIIFEILENRL